MTIPCPLRMELIRIFQIFTYVYMLPASVQSEPENNDNKIKPPLDPSPFDRTSVQDPTSDKSRGGGGSGPLPSESTHVYIKRIYHVDEVRIGKTRGVNLLVWTEPWRGPDGRFIPRVFPILTSSTWLIIYLAYSLLKLYINLKFFSFCAPFDIFRVGKCRLTSPSDVITTCVRTHSRTSNGWKRRKKGFPTIVKSNDTRYWIYIYCRQRNKRYTCIVVTLVPLITW